MDKKLSRRDFLGKAAAAMCTVMVFEFGAVAGAQAVVNFKYASSKGVETENMPHVIVKLWPGRSEQDKIRLAEAIVKDVVEIMGSGEGSVSVAIEEVPAADWKSKVYDPDIKQNMDKLYKKPGYSM